MAQLALGAQRLHVAKEQVPLGVGGGEDGRHREAAVADRERLDVAVAVALHARERAGAQLPPRHQVARVEGVKLLHFSCGAMV
jgi:hypothetical protein